jgi:hypothetical protein
MPLTILERIADVVQSRLQNLVGNPFYGSLVLEVIRPLRLDQYSPKDGQLVLTFGPSNRNEDLDVAGNPIGIAYEQQFNIHCHILNDETSDVGIDEIADTYRSVIIKAIALTSDWYSMNGLAMFSMFANHEPIPADGGMDGFNLPLLVTYRVSERDPYISRL